ncbi:VapD family protein [uncultured Oscillibacter sp.]|mgnify:FL=1|uniref:VapD family protein n=1 Tax=uncultured Oscillibacter sp. TaxID=876091 RepID=UPI0026155895|nr:VapD family protein [uncultured Oscillibacter sp.]
MGMTRKQISFDLSQDALKRYYPHKETGQDSQFFKRAYKDIRRFMEANGFERRQYSVYVSLQQRTSLDVALLAQRMGEALPWLRLCVKDITVTNIGARHSLLGLLRSDALSAELLPPVSKVPHKKRKMPER